MFDALDDAAFPPSSELMNFTNRSSELQVFRRVLELESPPPVLMFYGVGGSGKSWLLQRFREVTPPMPIAYLDLDRSTGGTNYADNYPLALAELRRQFSDIDCPQFDLAYTWLRVKEGVRDDPLFQGGGLLENTWEFILQVRDVASSEVPEEGLVKWLVCKVSEPIGQWLLTSSFGKWLDTRFGWYHFLENKTAPPQEIYRHLRMRLLFDLEEYLPARQGKAVRAVLFVDSVEPLLEELREERGSEEHLEGGRDWLQELYHRGSGLLIVLAGRDRLNWGDRREPYWAKTEVLEQHLVGGLSEKDARAFLSNGGITDPEVQEAILRVSLDSQTVSQGEPEYHPCSLGVSADTCWNLRQCGEGGDPDTFDMPADDHAKLTAPFLRSFAEDGTYAVWLHLLALTPRFDEAAARAAFGPDGAEQDAAWQALQSYSFLKPTDLPGWSSFHVQMKQSLVKDLLDNQPGDWQANHQWWRGYWERQSQAAFDLAAGLAWYHAWQLNPKAARLAWQELAESELRSLKPVNHAKLIEWWAPCDLIRCQADPFRRREAAAALHSLGTALCEQPLGDRIANLHRATDCYQAALRCHSEAAFPQEWASTQFNLGNAYQSFPHCRHGANLERAIACYQATLRVYTEAAFPQDWARTQHELAAAYRCLPTGDDGENLQRAIECCEAALRVRTEATFPQDWAATQNNLAAAYRSLSTGDRGENLQRAIECYQAMLRVQTEAEFPLDWARTQNNLAAVYRSLPTGDRGENLERAIACYQAVLRVRTESAFPQEWAITQFNLGFAYQSLPTGDRDENLNRTIACYQAVLRVQTEAESPREWEITHLNLGTAYQSLPPGAHGENLQRAIECYETAARVRTVEGYLRIGPCTLRRFDIAYLTERRGVASRRRKGNTQLKLGIAYQSLPTGDRGANMRRAIACYHAAVLAYREAPYLQGWAHAHNNLAAAYRSLPGGDRGDSLNRAIACYRAALSVRTEAAFPQAWADTQNNLAIAYRSSPTGDPSENLRRSIECCQEALRIRTEAAFPRKWAITQFHLGIAYQSLPTGDRRENLERAIACYQAALRVQTEAAFPQDWAMTQNNLAAAQQHLPTGDRGENLQRAIECYQAALRVYTESAFPQEWADTQNNLAVSYASSPTGDRGANLQRAIECHQAALRVQTEASFPLDWALTMANLGLVEKTIADEWQAEWGERGWDRDGSRKSAQRRLVDAIAMLKSLGDSQAAARCQVWLDQLG